MDEYRVLMSVHGLEAVLMENDEPLVQVHLVAHNLKYPTNDMRIYVDFDEAPRVGDVFQVTFQREAD